MILEPGRFLTAEAGLYITRVLSCKESRHKKFVVCDGGMNHNNAAAGNLGQVIKKIILYAMQIMFIRVIFRRNILMFAVRYALPSILSEEKWLFQK
jgi:diaminopimelate decarboxylase